MIHGQPDAALGPLEAARRLRQTAETNDLVNLACCASVRGQADKALQYLERAMSEGFDGAIDPEDMELLVGLRDDPRFQEVLQRMQAGSGCCDTASAEHAVQSSPVPDSTCTLV